MRRIICLLLCSVLLCGCETSENLKVEENEEGKTEEAMEMANIITNGGYVDVEREHDKYNSSNENTELSEYVCTTGKIVGEEVVKETQNFILEQDDGNKWAIALTSEMHNAKPISDSIMNKRVKVYGYYYGILDDLKIPMIAMLIDETFEIGEPALGKQKDYPRIEVENGKDKYEVAWNFYNDWVRIKEEESSVIDEETALQSENESTTGQQNALGKAKSYLKHSNFSYQGLIEQLKYENISEEEAIYAVDNCGADWNGQALGKAKGYLSHSAFSYTGLIEQLEYEGFTTEQATYAADNCGADWNAQAVNKAKSYLSHSSFSRDELIEQLEYEGFTHEQAVYGVEQNGY